MVENVGAGFLDQRKRARGGELTLKRKTCNKTVRGVCGSAERADALLEMTFKALRRVSRDLGAAHKSPPQPSSYFSSPAACSVSQFAHEISLTQVPVGFGNLVVHDPAQRVVIVHLSARAVQIQRSDDFVA